MSSTSVSSATAAQMASAPTMESQMQQVRYADQNVTRGALQLRDGDPMDFGVVGYARDPYDERAQIIREISTEGQTAANNLLGIPAGQVQRTLPITNEDIDYVHRWEAQQQELMFDKWIMSQFDMTKPAERDRVMKLFPRYHQRQKALVDSKLALMKKWIEIQMFGIRSEDDGRFLYNVNAGVIQLPKSYYNYNALTTALNPFNPEGAEPAGYGGKLSDRGVFNPLRYIRYDTARQSASFNDNNPAYPVVTGDANNRNAVGRTAFGESSPFWQSTAENNNMRFPPIPRAAPGGPMRGAQ